MTIKVGAYPDLSIDRGGNTLADGGGPAGTVASLVAANPQRSELHVHNNGSSTDTVFLGATGVAAGQGIKLAAGEKVIIKTTAEVFYVAGTGTPTVSYLEVSQA